MHQLKVNENHFKSISYLFDKASYYKTEVRTYEM